MLNLLMRRMIVAEKNKKGEELLSDGELLDKIYDWMGKIVFWADDVDGRKLAEDILKFLRDNEPEEDV